MFKKKKNNIFNPEVGKPILQLIGEKKRVQEWHPQDYDIEDRGSAIVQTSQLRPVVLYLLMFGIVIVFFAKLVNLQVVLGKEHELMAKDNSVRSYLIEAPRGQIADRNNVELVNNSADYIALIYPYNLPKDEKTRQDLIDKINTQIKPTPSLTQDILNTMRLKSFDPITIREGIDRNSVAHLRNIFADDSAVEISAIAKRNYITENSMSHIIGYIGKMSEADITNYPTYQTNGTIGKIGIEASYDKYLRGIPGSKQVEIDSFGRLQRVVENASTTVGSTVKLHLSYDLQKVLYDALAKSISDSKGKSGAAIALDPRTGGVLAFVSIPGFDANIFSGKTDAKAYKKLLEDKNTPMINRIFGGLYPPGSTIKPFIASSALDAGIIDENTTIITPPEIKIGEWVFPDWKPHGSANVKKAIAESNNIFFYALGGGYDKIQGLGSDLLKKYLVRFGMDEETGIDIPGEQAGLVPDRAWRKKVKNENWYIGDTYHMAIGQGDMLVTPLSIANATAAIANGGTLYEPRLVQEIDSAETGQLLKKIQPTVKRKNIINPEALRIVRDGMRLTITSGSGHSTFGDNFPINVAGKTGTAQFGSEGKTHAWFTSFAPYEDPKVVISVFVEAGGEGYQHAAPVAKTAYEWYAQNTDQFK